jgi:hypothetical protein
VDFVRRDSAERESGGLSLSQGLVGASLVQVSEGFSLFSFFLLSSRLRI